MAQVVRPNLCSRIFRFLFHIAVLAALFHLIIIVPMQFLLGGPRPATFYIPKASITTFNFTSSSNHTLHYSIELVFGTYNPNTMVEFRYDSINAHVHYEGQTLGEFTFPSFVQYPGYDVVFDPIVLRGVRNLSETDVYNRSKDQMRLGLLRFFVEMGFESRFQVDNHVSRPAPYVVRCLVVVAVRSGTGIARGSSCNAGPEFSIFRW